MKRRKFEKGWQCKHITERGVTRKCINTSPSDGRAAVPGRARSSLMGDASGKSTDYLPKPVLYVYYYQDE